MKVMPVKQYSEPDFPTRNIIDEHPELLRLVPKRWRGNPVVIAALTGMLAITLGVRSFAAPDEAKQKARVAPIFEHGQGQGSFGCVAVNPPVFLSEDEARKVILEEAKRAGIDFKVDSLVIDNGFVPITDRYGFLDREEAAKTGSSKDPQPTLNYEKPKPKEPEPRLNYQMLRLDGTDAKRKISFEYVSEEDFQSWEKRPLTRACTVDAYEMKKTAEQLAEGLKRSDPEGVFAVFYDPCVGSNDARKKLGESSQADFVAKLDSLKAKKETMSEAQYNTEFNKMWKQHYSQLTHEANELSREELRAQVKDFIQWLKAQGVI